MYIRQSAFRINVLEADIQFASSPSFSRPAARALRRACSQASGEGAISGSLWYLLFLDHLS